MKYDLYTDDRPRTVVEPGAGSVAEVVEHRAKRRGTAQEHGTALAVQVTSVQAVSSSPQAGKKQLLGHRLRRARGGLLRRGRMASATALGASVLWVAAPAVADVTAAPCPEDTACETPLTSPTPSYSWSVTPIPISPPDPLTITPSAGAPGDEVVVRRAATAPECEAVLVFDGAVQPARRLGGQPLAFTVPAHPPGGYAVELRCDDRTGDAYGIVGTGTFTVTEPPSVSPRPIKASDDPQYVVTVPDVVGMTTKQAVDAALHRRLDLVGGSTTSGRIRGQNPAAGTRIPAGSVVTVTLSRTTPPPRLATVPDVAGLTVAEARSRLRRAGFDLAPGQAGSGMVKAQRPVAGTRLPPRRLVSVTAAADRAGAPWLWVALCGSGLLAVAFALRKMRSSPRPFGRPHQVQLAPRISAWQVGVHETRGSPPSLTVRLRPRSGATPITGEEIRHGQH